MSSINCHFPIFTVNNYIILNVHGIKIFIIKILVIINK